MNQKILLVDDSAFMRTIIKNTLTDSGYSDFLEAEDGRKAIELYESGKPDLVILDLIMPNMDGVETLKKIRHIDEKAKVLVLTAIGQDQMQKECKKYGAAGYLIKPFEDKELTITVNNTLRH